MSSGCRGNVEREASEEQENAHERECCEEEIAPAESINGVNGRDGEKKIDYPKA